MSYTSLLALKLLLIYPYVQDKSTCFAHAAANFLGSYVLKNKLSAALDNSTIVSMQPIVDCFPGKVVLNGNTYNLYNSSSANGACDGGYPGSVLR